MSQEAALLLVWVTFTVVALGGVMAVFIWAVRARQFSDQDRARYLPLESGIPGDDEPEEGGATPPRDLAAPNKDLGDVPA